MRIAVLSISIVLSAISQAAAEGPSITDSQLFEMLDLGYPGLEKVASAVSAGDLTSAKHELAEYLRNRAKPVWTFDWRDRPRHETRPDGVDTAEADRILAHELPSVGVYHKFEGEIDWTLDPISYKEWPWQLNRHSFWVTLGRAYWATGEEKYAREFVFQMTDWIRRCPVPAKTSGNETATWRTIEAGIRTAGSWMESYHLFLTSPSFTDEAIVTMLKSFVEHARQLMKWPTSGNWLAMECNGLMHIGVMFPEFKDAAEWRKTATDRLYAELDRQVYPDGAQIELTTGYHQVSLGNFVRAYEVAKRNDVPMPADYIAKLEKMYDYDLDAAMPDGCLPGLNDACRTNIRPCLQQALTYFPDRTDFQWIATDGRQGSVPKVGSIPLAFSGQLVMRTGWKPDDLYLLMDAGPFGYGHQHEDALSFVIYSHGRYHLIDPGNYAYDSSEWRRYVLSTRAHNTIMVDGLDQSRRGRPRNEYVVSKPLPNRWASGAKLDYASGTYNDGYGPEPKVRVAHTRHIFFAKPEYWIVTDCLVPADDKPHHYESMFHLDAEGAETDRLTKAARTTNKDSSNLAIVPVADDGLSVRVVSGQKEPVVQGWVPSQGYEVRPIPTPIFSRDSTGPAHFAYVIYPTPAGLSCPIEAVEPLKIDGEGAVGMAIRFAGGRIDYFVQPASLASFRACEKSAFSGARKADSSHSFGMTGRVSFLDFVGDGEAIYVRTEGGRLKMALMAGGTSLTRAGRPVRCDIVPVQDLSRTEAVHKF